MIDVGKAWLATRVVAGWSWPLPGAAPAWLPAACATAAVLGHVYPLFHGFRGGKGAATWLGALLGMAPYTLLAVLSAWLITVILIGYVSLATMSAAWLLPLLLIATRPMPPRALLTFAVVMAIFITYTHRSNIARIRAGSEPRAKRLWLLGRGR